MRKVRLPFSDEAMVLLSEECGHEDGKIGARYKPPILDSERAALAYGKDYWTAFALAEHVEQMQPDRRIVRRAKMLVANKARNAERMMTDLQRQVWDMRCNGMRVREISTAIGRAPSSVEQTLARAARNAWKERINRPRPIPVYNDATASERRYIASLF